MFTSDICYTIVFHRFCADIIIPDTIPDVSDPEVRHGQPKGLIPEAAYNIKLGTYKLGFTHKHQYSSVNQQRD